jgi:hypothetical protein
MQLGLSPDLTWYKLLTDLGSLIGGGLALFAGFVAYLAGRIQARATREAAETQVAAERLKFDQDVETLRKSVAVELRQMVVRARGAHESLAKLLGPPSDQITARMIESSVGVPIPIVYPAIAGRIALLHDEAMDVVIVYQLIEIAREGARQLINSRTPDNISKGNVALVSDAFLLGCSYAKSVLPRVRIGSADYDEKDNMLIRKITETENAWNAVKAGRS